MPTMTTVQEAAEIAVDCFETARRRDDDEDVYVRVKDGSPDWIKDLVYKAHGDFLPDDWRYDCIRAAVEYIRDTDEPDPGEFADGHVDVYNGALHAWLGSNLQRAGYVDEAIAEFGVSDEPDINNMIAMGQYVEAQEVFASVLSSLEDATDEED